MKLGIRNEGLKLKLKFRIWIRIGDQDLEIGSLDWRFDCGLGLQTWDRHLD